jgi:transcriptional regulator with XRE-family HTH domain
MSKFSQNLRFLRKSQSLSQEALSFEVNISRSKVSAYEDDRSEPNIGTLVNFSEYFKLPIDALLRTDLTISRDGNYLDIGNNRVLFPVMINEENEDVIELVQQEAAAGYLQGSTDTEYIANLPIMNLSFLPTGKYRAFPIKGDSMTPWVKQGDFVVCEFMQDPKDVRSGDCYVILTKEDGLVYKRVNTSKMKDGYLILASDNKAYDPYEVHMSEILEIWEFTVNIAIGKYQNDEVNPSNVLKLLRNVGVELTDLKNRVDGIEEK